jgi:phosphatidylglycerophosphate synthase
MANAKNPKISEEIYPAWKEKANKSTIWEYYFARKIAFLLAPFFVRIRISANQISWLSFLMGIAGSFFIAVGNFWLILFGAILMQIWLILDKTDGIVARMKNRTTKFGEFFEELNGSLTAVLFFFSTGVAAFRIPGILFSPLIDPMGFVFLGTATSLCVVSRHLANGHFELVFGKEETDKREVAGNGVSGALYNFAIKFSGVYSLAQPIFILAIIFNFLGIFSVFYFMLQLGLMFLDIFHLILKARGK